MADLNAILQTPEVRAIVQERYLQHEFKRSLFPEQLFRDAFEPEDWPTNKSPGSGAVGDTQRFTRRAPLRKNLTQLAPGVDPPFETVAAEQYQGVLRKFGRAIQTEMPTALNAIVDLYLDNTKRLALQAGQSINAFGRNVLYNAGLSGNTVATGSTQSGTSLHVANINGFTRARRPGVSGASQVFFDKVLSTNPLPIHIFDNGASTANTVTGYTPDSGDPNDEQGPGTLTLGTSATSVLSRAYVVADDASVVLRAGGSPNKKIDDIGSTDTWSFQDVESAVAQLRIENVPAADTMGMYHCHLDAISEMELFNTEEMRRLITTLPDWVVWKTAKLAPTLSTLFIPNQECPTTATVEPRDGTFSMADPFGGETKTTAGLGVHQVIFYGAEAGMELSQGITGLITKAGLVGAEEDASQVGAADIVAGQGISLALQGISIFHRGPLNLTQDMVDSTWVYKGDFVAPTDATSGGTARYKRLVVVQHA